jgi:hypothetical protein
MNILLTLHRNMTRAARRPAAAVLAAAAVVLILSWSCKSPTSPSGGEADIVVTSHWDAPVDVFMDGTFKFPLGYKESAEIDNVSRKNHLMEAKSQVTGEVVAQTTLEVTSKTDYTWTIEHRARIDVANSVDETLKIFMDGVFQLDLVEGEDRWLIDVALGEHLLAALKASDGTQVASTTLKVTENKDYSWGISIIKGGRPVVIAGH